MAEAIGIAPFFLVDGLVCIVLGALVYLPKSVRALDHATPGAAVGTLRPRQKPTPPRGSKRRRPALPAASVLAAALYELLLEP